MNNSTQVAVIRGDGIGVDVTDATLAVLAAACKRVGATEPVYDDVNAIV